MAYQPATFELGRQLRLRHPIKADDATKALSEQINLLDQLMLDGRTRTP